MAGQSELKSRTECSAIDSSYYRFALCLQPAQAGFELLCAVKEKLRIIGRKHLIYIRTREEGFLS